MEPTLSMAPPAKVARLQDEKVSPWVCAPSVKASRTGKNNSMQTILKPIIDNMKPGSQRGDEKDPISLATADASLTHIPPCPKAMEAIVRACLRKPHTTLYTHSFGTLEARRAIASYHSIPGYSSASPEDVIVTNGCSAALDLALSSILDPGTSLLVPNPGFPLYEEIAESHGATSIKYKLDPNNGWECDLNHLEAIMNTASRNGIRAMVVNNPSSHGAVFSKSHLCKLLDFAFKHKLLIISDEVYGEITFGSHQFHPLANVAAELGQRVPIVVTSGLSKQFLVPGWRLGWAVFHDNKWGSLREIREGAQRLSKLQHGVSHLMQSAIPSLLSPTTPGLSSWKKHLSTTLEKQAEVICSFLESCPGLEILCPPQGSMYAIVHLNFYRYSFGDEITNDVDFCQKLVQEENIFVLPGSSFGVPGTFRLAFSAKESTLEEAGTRISRFCNRYAKDKMNDGNNCKQS